MQFRRVGASGLRVSAISLGSWLTYGDSVEQETANACVRAALEGGVNLFDSADVYHQGRAEEALCRALAPFPREEYVLATKVFYPAVTAGPNGGGLSRKHVVEACHGALRRLGTDYIDLFQCHRFDPDVPVEETARAMDDLIRQGKILYWGVSTWSAAQITWACAEADRFGAYRPISNQPPYSLLEWSIENEVLPACRSLGLGQIVFCPLAQGILTAKYRGGRIPAGSRGASTGGASFVSPYLTERNLCIADRVASLAARLGITPAQLSLAWVLRRPEVASAITGATRPEQVLENLRAAEVVLDADVIDQLDRWRRGED